MKVFSALRADLSDLNRRINPWFHVSELQSEVKTLRAQMAAAEAISTDHAAEIEALRARLTWYQQLEQRADHLEEQFRILYEIERSLEDKQVATAGQMLEFGNNLEKLRLRLSGPAADSNDKPKAKLWPDRRRELEREYATKSAITPEEKSDAGKGNAS